MALTTLRFQGVRMRWIVRLLGLVVTLAVLAVGALFLVPAERIANLAARQFEAATGRALTITGRVTPTFWPVLGARVEGVTLANVEGSNAGPMLVADTVDLGVDLSALMGGALVVRQFEARNPQIVLERALDGTGNWMFSRVADAAAPSEEPAGGGASLPPISLDRVQISGASLRYIDRIAGSDVVVEGVGIDLSMPEAGGAATLRVTLERAGHEAVIEATVGSVRALVEGGVVAVTARITAPGAEGSFEGRAGIEPLAADGRLSLSVSRLAPLLQLAGASGPEVLPAAAAPLSLAGQVTLAPVGSLHLRDGVLGLGANRLRLGLDATFDGPRPNIAGQISADTLDLSGFTSGGGGGTGGEGTGWPRERIDASALALADAQIGLALGRVDTGHGILDAFNGALAIDRARAVLSIREARGFDGTLTGELVANNRNGLSVGGNLAARNLGLMPLLRQTLEFERLSGTASMDLRFLGVGESVDAIMRSLEGQGSIAFGTGEILGFDLAAMLRNLDASAMGAGNSTIYDRITGSFTMQGGVLSNSDLRLEARLLDVTGSGTVDLGGQTLAYRVTPEAMRNASGEALSVPLLITGPWSAPRFRLDLEGLAEQRLREERERLEARAREEVARLEAEARARADAELAAARARAEAEVAERLQLTPPQGAEGAGQGQSLEDIARQELLRRLGGQGN